ncbi:MAG: NYN domain-containing protein [Polyangiaceae bacterium]|nr:NYN domain-containing protein [Polyangiaceae bacterium]
MTPISTSAPNIAIYCDFENVALGARDAKLESFDVGLVITRLLDKGKIIVKKAYADWDRYKGDRRKLHEAAFELIEIPHVSYSGKNSADIRLVVDALDLCYTKSHVEIFAIVSGDSDFSPLVSKLRENDKRVIGLGVKNSSSDLLIANCDEFIYYDDLVREKRTATESVARRGKAQEQGETGRAKPRSAKAKDAKDAKDPKDDDVESRRLEGLELVLETVEALFRDRDESLWGSAVKQTIKRKRPTFSETFHGYRSFNALLEDAEQRGLLEIEKDQKSGGYLIASFGPRA